MEFPDQKGGHGDGEAWERRAGGGGRVTLSDDIKLLWLSLSDMSSKKGCRLGGAVTDGQGGGTPLVSRCSPAFCP